MHMGDGWHSLCIHQYYFPFFTSANSCIQPAVLSLHLFRRSTDQKVPIPSLLGCDALPGPGPRATRLQGTGHQFCHLSQGTGDCHLSQGTGDCHLSQGTGGCHLSQGTGGCHLSQGTGGCRHHQSPASDANPFSPYQQVWGGAGSSSSYCTNGRSPGPMCLPSYVTLHVPSLPGVSASLK